MLLDIVTNMGRPIKYLPLLLGHPAWLFLDNELKFDANCYQINLLSNLIYIICCYLV